MTDSMRQLLASAVADAPQSVDQCDTCADTGWKPVTSNGVAAVTRCDCVQRRRYAEGVPKEFQLATLDNYERRPWNATAVELASSFVIERKFDLMFVGGVGSGKTRLVCSILNVLLPVASLFVRVPAMLKKLQPGGDEAERVAFDAKLRAVPLLVLVLDDVGAERDQATEFTRRTVSTLYEERHDQGFHTIWTSNKDLDELSVVQDDDRLTSRLAGWANVVMLDGPDQRLKGRRMTMPTRERP